MSAIVVRGLSKKFRKNLVLDQLDLEVNEGEIFSLMGLKNSGKTTFARILFHFLKANQGSITVFDMDAIKDAKIVKEFCSYVPEDVWIYDNLKPISIFKRTLGFHDLKNMDDVHFLMDMFEVDNKEKFIDMSDSKRKRVAIINALISKPKLLVLDEPNKYLSVGMVEKVFTHLRHLQTSEGLSVLVLTDSLSLGQRYSDRAAYLSDGRIVDLEYIKDKDTNDKVLKVFDDIVTIDALESIGAKLLREDQGESEFFYNGYLPTLTTVLYQERIKNFTLEDALLENKIESYSSKSKASPEYISVNDVILEEQETVQVTSKDEEIKASLEEDIDQESTIIVPQVPIKEEDNESKLEDSFIKVEKNDHMDVDNLEIKSGDISVEKIPSKNLSNDIPEDRLEDKTIKAERISDTSPLISFDNNKFKEQKEIISARDDNLEPIINESNQEKLEIEKKSFATSWLGDSKNDDTKKERM